MVRGSGTIHGAGSTVSLAGGSSRRSDEAGDEAGDVDHMAGC